MGMMVKKRILLVVGTFLLVPVALGGGLIAAIRFDFVPFSTLVQMLMQPRGSFVSAPQPAAPDYGNPAHWSALPARQDAADAVVPKLPTIDQRTAPADVF